MTHDDVDSELRRADPAAAERMAWLSLEPAEAALAEEIVAAPAATAPADGATATWPGRHRRGRALGLAGLLAAAAAVAVAVILLFGGGASESPSGAYAAEVVRFAESTPLLLLEGPGWRVQTVNEERQREGLEGSMEFVTGKPIPYESIRITGGAKREYESGMFPPATRQRRVELFWRQGSLAQWLGMARSSLHPHGQHWVRLPVLGTSAHVDTRAEFYANQGGPGNRQMTALWQEGGYVLELKAAVPDLAAFEERLGWLTAVDSQTWLDAMPAKVVKAADHDASVREMLKGIPVPSTFTPARVPDEGFTTNRYQVGAPVTGTVTCLWFRQWGAARRSGDRPAQLEAERAMATSRHWKILREMAKEGAYPELIWELAAAMPQGHYVYAGHVRRLLPKAEGLGCARWGIPVLPWKQGRQNERAEGSGG
jgi:hypothetical protein